MSFQSKTLGDRIQRISQLGQTVWLIGVLSLLVIGALFYFGQRVVSLERQQAFAQFENINSKIVLSDEVRIRSLIETLDKVMLVIRDDFLIHRGMTQQEMLRRLNVLKIDNELAPRISITDAAGDVILSSSRSGTPDKLKINLADRDYFQKQKVAQDDSLAFGTPVQSRVTGKWVVPVSRRIDSNDGAFAGIVVLSVDPSLFTAPFEKTSLGENAARAILGLDGYTLLRLNNNKLSYGGDSRKSQVYEEIKKSPAGCYTAIAVSDGERRVACYRVINPYPLIILSGSSVTAIESSLTTKTYSYAAAACGLVVLILLVAWLLIRGVLSQKALVETQDSLNRLIEMVPQTICRMDALGNIVWANNRLIAYVGPSAQELAQGFGWVLAAMHPDDLGPLEAFIREALQKPSDLDSLEFRQRRFDGAYLWYALQVTRNGELGTKGEFLLLAGTEIHDRKMAQERAALTQKLESIGQLTGGMAHDFNNLLAIIIGNLDLAKGEPNAPLAAGRLDTAINAAQRGVGLVKSLLALASRQPLLPVQLDLLKLVDRIAPLLKHALGPRTNFQLVTPPQPMIVKVDAASLEAVLLNLIVNARDAMSQGGSLKLTLQERHGMACITVEDTGEGMPEAVLKRATEPFFTTKAQGHGTGLGLSTCVGFAKQSGGAMTIASTPGEGTTVEITLPLVASVTTNAAPSVNAAATMGGKLPGGKLSILIVDDESELAEILLSWAKEAGHSAIVLPNADDALTLLAARAFDVLLTDIVMPGTMDGIGLADKAIALRPNMKVVLMSGYSRETATNSVDVKWPLLVKPFGRKDFDAALAAGLAAA